MSRRWLVLLVAAGCGDRAQVVEFDYPPGFENGTQMLAVARGDDVFDEFYAVPVGEPFRIGEPLARDETARLEAWMYSASIDLLPYEPGAVFNAEGERSPAPDPNGVFVRSFADGDLSDWEVGAQTAKLFIPEAPCPQPELQTIDLGLPDRDIVAFAGLIDARTVRLGTSSEIVDWSRTGTISVATATVGGFASGAVVEDGDTWLAFHDGRLGRMVSGEPLTLVDRHHLGEATVAMSASPNGRYVLAYGLEGRLARFADGEWEDLGTFGAFRREERELLVMNDGTSYWVTDSKVEDGELTAPPVVGVYRNGQVFEEPVVANATVRMGAIGWFGGRVLAAGRVDGAPPVIMFFERNENGTWTETLRFTSTLHHVSKLVSASPDLLYAGGDGTFGMIREDGSRCVFPRLSDEHSAVALLPLDDVEWPYFSVDTRLIAGSSPRLIKFDPPLGGP